SGSQSIIKRKWNETCKYLTVTGGSYSPWLVTADLKFWNKLPEDIQKAVSEAAAEISLATLKRAGAEDAKAMAEAEKTMEVYRLTEPWAEAKQASLEAWKKRIGAKEADKILKLINK
ncbi:MAG: hypothetical protein MI702_05365, partial [Chlorobiales bacterium]|nr:hypothetical protein [Chlorobiales bacterium]